MHLKYASEHRAQHDKTWHALLSEGSEKAWLLYPTNIPYQVTTGCTAPTGWMQAPQTPGFANNISQWISTLRGRLPVKLRPVVCMQQSGDVLFLPAGCESLARD